MKLQYFFPRLYLVLIGCACLGLTPNVSHAQYSGIATLTYITNKCNLGYVESECTGLIMHDEEECDLWQYIGDPCEEGQEAILYDTAILGCIMHYGNGEYGGGNQCVRYYLCCDAP